MAYEVFPISIVKNSTFTRASPQRTFKTLPAGLINKVDIEIPQGVKGLAGMRILFGGTQRYPSSSGEYITGNAETVIIIDNFNLKNNTDKFIVIETYNLDELNDHTLTVRFNIT